MSEVTSHKAAVILAVERRRPEAGGWERRQGSQKPETLFTGYTNRDYQGL